MTRATGPWYRHRWPWLLAIGPAVVLCAGAYTFWLAASGADSMVVDDYYREGRAINQQLERDRKARALGLHATLSAALTGAPDSGDPGGAGSAGPTITLTLNAREDLDWPPQLTLRLVHAARAELDAELVLRHTGGGVYRTQAVLPAGGRWLLQVEDPGRAWRLVEPRVARFDRPIALGPAR